MISSSRSGNGGIRTGEGKLVALLPLHALKTAFYIAVFFDLDVTNSSVYPIYYMEKQIGKVIHWYDKIGVAVLKLTDTLKKGDTIKIKREKDEFDETVASMQLDHEDVDEAKKGSEVAVKLSQKAHDGALIYKET